MRQLRGSEEAMNEYTPTVEELAKNTTIRDRRVVALTREERTRGIAKVQADALREAAGAWQVETGGTRPGPRNFMVRRADRIEREARDGS